MPKSKKRNPSSTAGIKKNENCKKSPLKTRMAKDSRFYKDVHNYEKACKEIGKLKGNMSYPPSEAAIEANERALSV